ncbi:hypothetical protein HMPREF1980_00976 [Actinomyces sp. oral taxon 172 str. F0311]|nr:hypothetical protein HMPREF1980_00976 [Actinomyces sp. oral taxon 172 str. F0311]
MTKGTSDTGAARTGAPGGGDSDSAPHTSVPGTVKFRGQL